MENEPSEINYSISADEQSEVIKKVKACKKELGAWLKVFDDYFKKYETYNKNTILDYTMKNNSRHIIKSEEYEIKIMWYARLDLGLKIEKFFEENSKCDCYFIADL